MSEFDYYDITELYITKEETFKTSNDTSAISSLGSIEIDSLDSSLDSLETSSSESEEEDYDNRTVCGIVYEQNISVPLYRT